MENIPHMLWPCVCKCSEGFSGEAQKQGLQLEATPQRLGTSSVLRLRKALVHKQQQQLPHCDTKWYMETCYKIKTLSNTEG